ncbi:MAG: hypothetical protein EPO36_12415 [Chloroflexota bacterium]|nr:MAG: hypothetical protein EPO36_12415 [Chloroflexota bacterium]
MQFDLGIGGFGILVAISLLFGLAAQLVVSGGSRWMWLIAAAGWFVGGIIASEVIWGKMTEGELQPIIDGLALDESLLGGLVVGVLAVLVARFTIGRITHGPHPV